MIPNKSVFKFQELTPITGVKPYVIRFWETEFEDIDPVTSDTGEKLYARKDVELILKVKKLLFDDKLSIQEAKLALKNVETVSTVAESWKGQVEELTTSSSSVGLSSHAEAKAFLRSALELIKEIKSSRHW